MILKEYQIEAIEFFKNSKYGCLINLPPGSGKSVIAYSVIEHPALFCSYKFILYEHMDKLQGDIDFVTPQKLYLYMNRWLIKPYKILIFDESHMFKNRNSKQSKAAQAICCAHKNAKKLLMTATPTPESIGEIYPQMCMLSQSILGSKADFIKKYEREYGNYHRKYYIHSDEISKKCAPYIFAKKVELPFQETKTILLEMPEELRLCYNEFKDNCSLYLDKKLIISQMIYAKLLQICAGFIIDTKASIIENKTIVHRLSDYKAKFIAQMVEEINDTCIVWGTFREELKMLHEVIKDSELIMGGQKDGQEIVKSYKDGSFHTLVANSKCIGAGVSLEIAHYQIASSIEASCCQYIQSVARTNRINQTFNVVRYEILYKDSLEEKLAKKVKSKVDNQQRLIESLMQEEFKW